MSKTGRVFISYERGDAEIAASLRLALRAEELDVWWDEELKSGQHWAEVIDDELLGAKAIVVLWSEKSAKSDWVCHEASIGKVRGILTHARIDSVDIPTPFRSVQVSNLSNWNNRENDPEFRKLVDAIVSKRSASYRELLKNRQYFMLAGALLLTCSLAVAWYVSNQQQQYEETIDKLSRQNEVGVVADGQAVWRARIPVRLRTAENQPLSADYGELQQVRIELEPPITSASANDVGFWVVSEDGKFPTARFTIPNVSIAPETLDLNDSNKMMHKTDALEMNGIAPIWLTIGSTYNAEGADPSPEGIE